MEGKQCLKEEEKPRERTRGSWARPTTADGGLLGRRGEGIFKKQNDPGKTPKPRPNQTRKLQALVSKGWAQDKGVLGRDIQPIMTGSMVKDKGTLTRDWGRSKGKGDKKACGRKWG